jgi:hypothetical protein
MNPHLGPGAGVQSSRVLLPMPRPGRFPLAEVEGADVPLGRPGPARILESMSRPTSRTPRGSGGDMSDHPGEASGPRVGSLCTG